MAIKRPNLVAKTANSAQQRLIPMNGTSLSDVPLAHQHNSIIKPETMERVVSWIQTVNRFDFTAERRSNDNISELRSIGRTATKTSRASTVKQEVATKAHREGIRELHNYAMNPMAEKFRRSSRIQLMRSTLKQKKKTCCWNCDTPTCVKTIATRLPCKFAGCSMSFMNPKRRMEHMARIHARICLVALNRSEPFLLPKVSHTNRKSSRRTGAKSKKSKKSAVTPKISQKSDVSSKSSQRNSKKTAVTPRASRKSDVTPKASPKSEVKFPLGKRTECPNCGKSMHRSSLQQHSKICGITGPTVKFPCEVQGCKAIFRTAWYRYMHMRNTHQNSGKLDCPVDNCGTVVTKSRLPRHLKTTHGISKMPVKEEQPESEDSFQTVIEDNKSKKLKLTIKGEKFEFVCLVDGCDRSFMSNPGMKRHMTVKHKGIVKCPREGCFAMVTKRKINNHLMTNHVKVEFE